MCICVPYTIDINCFYLIKCNSVELLNSIMVLIIVQALSCEYYLRRFSFINSAMLKGFHKHCDIYPRKCKSLNNIDSLFQNFVTQSEILSIYKLDKSFSHELILSLLGIPCHVILLHCKNR